MKSRSFVYLGLVLVTIFVFCASSLLAQSGSTSALTGRITDRTGAVLPGVTVIATSIATNQTRTVLAAEDGVYRIPLLDPGAYRVRFSAPGFKTSEVMSVTLTVTETFALDQTLEVGAPTEEITVEAVTETIQTATSTIGTTVTGNQITSFPLSARNFTAVLGMSSGVAVDVSNATSFGRGSQNMSVNGANPEKNNFQMDGVSVNNAAGNNEAADGGLYTGIAIPNPDSIQEFKIQTSTYDASYGRNPGANVNVVTKGGSNEFHGTLFEFFRNEKLNANDFFFNRDRNPNGPTKQILRQNQFGGTLGGPIKENKLFFFGSYQGTRQLNGVAAQGTTSATLYPVPDNREAGDFPARLGAATCGFATRGGS
ncbi:MAG TPA: TonB-dependent receptor, partial [Terriglobia bacterium]|nr:TonB-dependent receptor [Terriglobia bacterium]